MRSLQPSGIDEVERAGNTRPETMRIRLLMVAGSTGQRNTVHPYRQGFEAQGVPATWRSDDPRLYKHE